MRHIAVLSLLIPSLAAAVPMTLQHQGRLQDSSGAPLEGSHTIDFRFYDAPNGGTPLWEESQTIVFDQGYFQTTLGASPSNAIELDDFDGSVRYLGLAVDAAPELPGRLNVMSVPYAIRSSASDTATNVSGGVVDASEIRVNGTTVIGSDGSLVAGGSLGALSCSADEIAIWSGTAWECGANLRSYTELSDKPFTLSDLSACASGQIPVFDGSSWTCAADAGLTVESDPTVNDLAKASLACTSGQIAKFNGSVWTCATDSTSGGTVTAVTADAPLASSGGVTPNLTIAEATDSTAGFLTAADWTTFNGKVGSVSATEGGGMVVAGTTTAPTVGLLTDCSAGQTLKWDGAAWACAADIATAQMPIQTVCGWRTCGDLNLTNIGSCNPDACPTGYTSVNVSCTPIDVDYAQGISTYASSIYTNAACTSLSSNRSGNMMVGACHRSCERTVPSANVIAVTECSWKTCGDLNQANIGSCSPAACPSGYTSISVGCSPTSVAYAQGIGGFANSMYTDAACTTESSNRSGNITVGKCSNICQK